MAKKKKKPKKRKSTRKTFSKGKGSHLRQSKTDDFLQRIRQDNSMVDYFMRLRIMNPAAQLLSPENQTRREGSFVRLAHANEEFTAPVLTKGKAVIAAERERAHRRKKARNPSK